MCERRWETQALGRLKRLAPGLVIVMGLGGPQDPSRVLRGRGSSFSLGFASRFSDLFRAIWRRFSCLAATSVLETVALAAGLEDVAAMRQPVECRARESLAAEHLGPVG